MNAAKTNHISLSFDAISENEAFARMTAAMFMAQLNPTLVQKFLNKWTIFLFCSILFSSNQKEH